VIPPMNLLAGSTSPYLLQHADNPVHWEPWGEAAIARARRENKAIFLSVGYSACHWCHVMAHECFENEAIARLLNENFVNVKVDREERPDIDAVYMQAVQLLTGRGGWPMSVFLTPGLEPFFAGTYWPPEPRQGLPGFPQVVAAVVTAWRERREAVVKQAGEITAAIAGRQAPAAGPPPTLDLVERAAASLARSFDPEWGGFGRAPKFPHAMDLRLLLRSAARSGRMQDVEMVVRTLERMAAGGIHDQLGGGFARYSVDDQWLVPHFEKMLYDNALLATAYLEAFQVTGRADFAAVVRSTLDYLLRDMTDPAGGFWAAEDADSEGHEGRYYVWTPAEVAAELDPVDATLFCAAYDITPAGNFEGRSIPNLPRPLAEVAREQGLERTDVDQRLAAARANLLLARGRRVRPGTDDKVLVAWNGLAIDALARAGAALPEPRYVAAASRAAEFLLQECRDATGRIAHQWRRGQAGGLAFADDLACLAEGLVSLYESTFDERWIRSAMELADRLVGEDDSGPLSDGSFLDPETGGVFQTSPAHERLILRQPDLLDQATPSATGMAATVLLRLAAFTGRDRYRRAAERALEAAADLAARAPAAMAQSLAAIDVAAGPVEEAIVVGPDSAAASRLLDLLRRRFRPRGILAWRPPGRASIGGPLDLLFSGREGFAAEPTLYRCSAGACQEPLVGAAAEAALAD
jgi:uncharacterized protein YyaL (SSP411 family)